MKKKLYIACTLIVCLGILAYAFDFNGPTLSPQNQNLATEKNTSAVSNTLKSNLDTIPNFIEPEEVKSTLTSEQKKQYEKLNETQQKEALSAMGQQQGIKDMVTYAEIELDRLKESDKELAKKDKRAEDIIQTLKAQVALKNENPEDLNPQ